MTRAVLVHGNPETAVAWSSLVDALGHDTLVALSPPGFGAPIPDGFGATADEHVTWLVGALEEMAEPVDLVGHDRGGGHGVRVAVERPDLLRSWAVDIAGCFAPDYVWHDLAQVWQTPGAGEQAVSTMVATAMADLAARDEAMGMARKAAWSVAEATDEAMGRCILARYRSAAQPYLATLGRQLPRAGVRLGLVIAAERDAYVGGVERARRAAEQAGARLVVRGGVGHWWMLQDPEAGAGVLRDLWGGLGQW